MSRLQNGAGLEKMYGVSMESPLSAALGKLQTLARWAEVPDGFYNGVSRRTLGQARAFLFVLSGLNSYLKEVTDTAVSGIRITYTRSNRSLIFYVHESGPEFFCRTGDGEKGEIKAFDIGSLPGLRVWLTKENPNESRAVSLPPFTAGR